MLPEIEVVSKAHKSRLCRLTSLRVVIFFFFFITTAHKMSRTHRSANRQCFTPLKFQRYAAVTIFESFRVPSGSTFTIHCTKHYKPHVWNTCQLLKISHQDTSVAFNGCPSGWTGKHSHPL